MPNWKSDGRGIQPGGDCGGDYQSTDAFNVHNIDTNQTRPPFSVIDVTFYGEDPHSNDARSGSPSVRSTPTCA